MTFQKPGAREAAPGFSVLTIGIADDINGCGRASEACEVATLALK
jgi:hypothetical protein